MIQKVACTLLIILLLSGCGHVNPSDENSRPIKHRAWNGLLQHCVDEQGYVDYPCFIKRKGELEDYFALLQENVPNESWSKAERLAYWINAYNAYTVGLILSYYPIGSIKDIGPSLQIPRINTPWQIDFIPLGDKPINLDNIEHDIIRTQFGEPRIHFALVCAAISCPKLRNEAYEAARLEEQLDDQAGDFLRNPIKNQLKRDKVSLSRIFLWYGSDFKKEGISLIDYLNEHTTTGIKKDADITYMKYDWRLNAVSNR